MKRKNLCYVFMILLLSAGFASCSSDDEEDPLIAEGLKTPEFSIEDLQESISNVEQATNGTWEIVRVNGYVQSITFGYNASPETPNSPDDFFNEYLPVTTDNVIKPSEHNNSDMPHYRQFYKGVPVERGTWHFEYREDALYKVWGHFVPIEQLNVTPTISEPTAKKIVEKYLEKNVKPSDGNLEKRFYLAIMVFPVNNTMEPRLVYAYKQENAVMGGDYVYVDAQTGRLLLHINYHGATLDF